MKYFKFGIRRSSFFLFASIVCLNSCTKVNLKKTDLKESNFKGAICLIIEKEYEVGNEKEILLSESVIKYNKYGNLASENKGGNKIICSYDENGNVIVKKETNLSYFFGEGLKPISKYWKYSYGENNFICEINEYNEVELSSRTLIERDKKHYKTKVVEITYKIGTATLTPYWDTITTLFYRNNKGKYIEEEEISGKRRLRKKFVYNSNGLLTSVHEKDLVVYKDSTASYKYIGGTTVLWDQPNYEYEDINKNILCSYKYDENDNVIHYHIYDSTNNTRGDIYQKYQYDSYGNWTRAEAYDNLYELFSYITREIEYYPKDEKTGTIDYSWENEISPLEKKYNEEKIRKQKEETYLQKAKAYLNDEFVLEQFKKEMKQYPDYKVINNPEIVYRQDCTYNINFNVRHKIFGYTENITVQIILYLETDKYSFHFIKGNLL